ncbi:cytochrome P450 [Coniochaeta ligniaria NRRL 30616]|uniref:Cytochrome P450 n=1 Tax=Coniochaeta ligniaria NRRL 30616 TaxID=1408157 RepID=A0A1J7ITY9_9PEZI|nr:cytochrome P450 [Coniochaeta ligniaria NRRL 30616]
MAFTDLLSSFWGMISSLSFLHTTILLLTLSSISLLALALHRLYLSPLSPVPGPRLAALTWLYEFYYDIVLGGQYTFKIIRLHAQYGPIIRINPSEIHIGDPDFYAEVYASGTRRREKWRFFTKQFGADDSALSTVDHELHRTRRAAVAPFFSTQSVRRLQPVVEERVDALLHRLRGTRGVVDLMYPFSAFTNDVIEEYSFARSHHLIEAPDFGREVTDTMLTGTHYGKWIQHIEVVLKAINALPESVSAALVPGWAGFLAMKRDIRAQIGEIKETENTERWQFDVDHPTVFHEMLGSKVLPAEEKTVGRLAQEGQILVQGGTLTTSWTLAVATFHLLERPETLGKLRDALFAAMPDPAEVVPLAELEGIAYLRAVVKESLRLGFGTSGRLARVAPDETLVYTDKKTGRRYEIPPGVPVGMTTYKTVTDERLFPDPFGFHPERWLGEGEEQRLEKYFTVFGGGSRVCLGMALAQAELFLMLAKMFRVWGGEGDRREGDVGVVKLFETTVRDCEMAADYFIPIPWKGTKGIRAVFEVLE